MLDWRHVRDMAKRYPATSRLMRAISRQRFAPTRGVLHIGANSGQEREYYRSRNLRVVWVEPIPAVFARLKANIAGIPQQVALQALVTERDGEPHTLHISNNDGESSSILELAQHRDIWPAVEYVERVDMIGVSLPKLLSRNHINLTDYDALVLDTQGSELMVLRGAHPILDLFEFIKTEAADFESYAGCAKRHEITGFLKGAGFREMDAVPFASHRDGGRYFDVYYRRR